MARISRLLATALAEGPRSLRDRLLDRWAERRRRRSFRRVDPTRAALGVGAPALILMGTPPAPRLGGVQTQLVARLRGMESAGLPYALLYPWSDDSFRLELSARGVRRFAVLPRNVRESAVALRDPELAQVLRRALDLTGASVLHVEHPGNMPPGELAELPARVKLLLSVHDFTLFCPRPHLLERPQLRFCGYCHDLPRCTACLRADWRVSDSFQAERRAASSALLRAADRIVFPSRFLRRTFQELFPEIGDARSRVIAPPRWPGPLPGPGEPRRRERLHVALVGGARAHKGGEVFEKLLRGLSPEERRAFRWTVLGGGDADLVQRIRHLQGVGVRGYYRTGSLPRLLRQEEVDVVLLLSVVPESYSLALTESLAAGVPVIAFDHGAVGERLRRHGGGILVPLEEGWEGVHRGLLRVRREGPEAVPPAVGVAPNEQHGGAADAVAALYRELAET